MRFKHEFMIQTDIFHSIKNIDRREYEKRLEIKGATDIGQMIYECFGFKDYSNEQFRKEIVIHAFPEDAWIELKEGLRDLFMETESANYLLFHAESIFRKLEELGSEKAKEINEKRNPTK